MHYTSAQNLSEQFKNGEVSAQEIVSFHLKRIANHDPKIQAFLSLCSERVKEKARLLDLKRKSGAQLGKLAGIPIALKDNIHLKGEITTCGSKFLENYRAVFDATVSQLMEEEDALIIGKTNCDEFAMGSSTEKSAFFPTKNPWDLNASPGGSSGGSAAAVAAGFSPLSLGSDTGGSIRQPAAFCGIVGFKPTYGRVSRSGLVAFASSLDQIGPFARSVSDAALLMEVIARHTDDDATNLSIPQEKYREELKNFSPRGLKVGIPWRFLEGLSVEARKNFEEAIRELKSAGLELVDIDLEILNLSIAVYYILATAEASTNLARFDGVRYGTRASGFKNLEELYDLSRQQGFGPEVKNRILLGTYVLSSGYKDAYYRKAQQVRTLIIKKFHEVFALCDYVAMPTSPTTAFELGSLQDPLQMYLQDIYTISANLAGLPAISVPSGFSSDKKPFGLQLLSPSCKDSSLLSLAHLYESHTQWHKQIPPFAAEAL